MKNKRIRENLEKAHRLPQKSFQRNQLESSKQLLLIVFPVCSQTSLCL